MGYYNLFLAIGVLFLVIYLIYINFKEEVKKVVVNPIDALLGAFLLILLWYSDVITLGMAKFGFGTREGILQVLNSQTPAICLFIINILGMFAVALWWAYENYNIIKDKMEKKQNWIFLTLLGLGLIIFITSSLYIGFSGYGATIFGLNLLGVYHFSLPFIIISTLFLMLERK